MLRLTSTLLLSRASRVPLRSVPGATRCGITSMTATTSSLGALAMPNVDASTARRGRCDVADRMRALGVTDYVERDESTQGEVDGESGDDTHGIHLVVQGAQCKSFCSPDLPISASSAAQ